MSPLGSFILGFFSGAVVFGYLIGRILRRITLL